MGTPPLTLMLACVSKQHRPGFDFVLVKGSRGFHLVFRFEAKLEPSGLVYPQVRFARAIFAAV